MAGIYLHIPFCKQACTYCDFYFVTRRQEIPRLVQSMEKELQLRGPGFTDEVIETIYFGGGTPSLLSPEQINGLVHHIRQIYQVSPDAEITLEANPDDLSPEACERLRSTPVNRVSVGIQSFVAADLEWMHRSHNAQQAIQCIKNLQQAGFHNITIDLIYGSPALSNEDWQHNLDTAFTLGVPHISAHCLTVEPRTALDKLVLRGRIAPVDEEKQAHQLDMLIKAMRQKGWEQYEISNFCRNGHYSKHNTAYWQGKKYLGLGPSAHSFNGFTRQWNVRDLHAYIAGIENGQPELETEILSLNDRYNEYIMTSLRTQWGCDLNHIRQQSGESLHALLLSCAQTYLNSGHLQLQNGCLQLTHEGKFIADRIASDLFATARFLGKLRPISRSIYVDESI